MTPMDRIRAWKDPSHPEHWVDHPAGAIELTNEEQEMAGGAGIGSANVRGRGGWTGSSTGNGGGSTTGNGGSSSGPTWRINVRSSVNKGRGRPQRRRYR